MQTYSTFKLSIEHQDKCLITVLFGKNEVIVEPELEEVLLQLIKDIDDAAVTTSEFDVNVDVFIEPVDRSVGQFSENIDVEGAVVVQAGRPGIELPWSAQIDHAIIEAITGRTIPAFLRRQAI